MLFKSSVFFLIAVTLASSSIFSMELEERKSNNNTQATALRSKFIKKKKNKQLIALHAQPLARLKLRSAINLQQSRELKKNNCLKSRRIENNNTSGQISAFENNNHKSETGSKELAFSSSLANQTKLLQNANKNNNNKNAALRPNSLKQGGRINKCYNLFPQSPEENQAQSTRRNSV